MGLQEDLFILSNNVGALEDDHAKLAGKIASLEHELNSVIDEIDKLNNEVGFWKSKAYEMEARALHAEHQTSAGPF